MSAQSGTVTGRVVEGTTQEPLAGATVSVAQRSAVTGADGRFTVGGVPAGSQTVRATRIGYGTVTRTVTVSAGQPVEVELSMTGSALQLEGVVVVGYGEQRQRDVTGSVQAVTAEDFNTGRVVSAEQLIQGKVAGVQVVDNGEPGGGINIRIRGGTSINASNEPLFVVDGVPLAPGGGIAVGRTAVDNALVPGEIGRNPLAFLNPRDIASVTVLKDAAATAIYGSRGANGVVIIETLSGQRGTHFSYTTSLSTSRISGEMDLLSADEYREAVREYAPENLDKIGNGSTDWLDQVQRDGFGQEHDLALSGTSPAGNYRLSLAYLDQEGVLQGSSTRRASGAVNYSQRLFSDALSVRASVRGSRTEDEYTPNRVLGAATAYAPTLPVRGEDGGFTEYADPLAPKNPVPSWR